MKKVFSLLAMAAIVLSVGLSSCAKEDTADSLNVDLNRTATINGTILVIADETKTGDDKKWSAPEASKIKVVATVEYSELNSAAASGTYTVTNFNYSDGKFSIVVPVGNQPTSVNVKVLQWQGDVKKVKNGTEKTYSVIWDSQDEDITVSPGDNAYLSEWTLESGDYKDITSSGEVAP